MAADAPNMPSLSVGTPERQNLKEEPNAVTPHVRICAGGDL